MKGGDGWMDTIVSAVDKCDQTCVISPDRTTSHVSDLHPPCKKNNTKFKSINYKNILKNVLYGFT